MLVNKISNAGNSVSVTVMITYSFVFVIVAWPNITSIVVFAAPSLGNALLRLFTRCVSLRVFYTGKQQRSINQLLRWLKEQTIVLCGYSKFQIESKSYFSIRFNSTPTQLFEIFKYLSLVHNAVFGEV